MTKKELINEIKKLTTAYNLPYFADINKWSEAKLKDYLKGLNISRSLCEC